MSVNPFGASRWWLIVYLGISISLIFAAFSNWAYDDPFITYRYAYNLAHGLGFVYNPGERVLSTTTPLFTFLLAPFSGLHFDLPKVAVFLGAVSIVTGGLFLWFLAATWGNPRVGWAGLALYSTFPLIYATLGSETPLYITFCLGSLMFYARSKYNWTALFCALATLTRPDGVLVPVILVIEFLLRAHRPVPWKSVFIFLGLTLPWFIFAWIYFGSPLPVTLAAKQRQGAMAISLPFASGFLYWARSYARYWYYWVEAALALIGLIYATWRERRWLLLLVWTMVYFLAYSILGVSRYHWYYAPLVPGFIISTGIGVYIVAAFLSSILKEKFIFQSRATLNYLLTGIFFVGILGFSIGQGYSLVKLQKSPDNRFSIYREIGIWLRQNTPPDALVGTLEVGIIGYYSQRPMLDFGGLIQPAVRQQLTPTAVYADVARWATQHYQPEYLVLHSGAFPDVEKGYAKNHCQIVRNFPKDAYGFTTDMDIYKCTRVAN
jgi:hypothetical protein